jgi:hypothetical protein
MVLLQNEPIAAVAGTSAAYTADAADTADAAEKAPVLPFDLRTLKTLAVLGPNADQPQCGDYAAGGSWSGDHCGGGPINNKRTKSVLGGIKDLAAEAVRAAGGVAGMAGLQVAYQPGVSIADFAANASYFTTIQAHSFTTITGEPGIIGKYYPYKKAGSIDDDNVPAPKLTRNDYVRLHVLRARIHTHASPPPTHFLLSLAHNMFTCTHWTLHAQHMKYPYPSYPATAT